MQHDRMTCVALGSGACCPRLEEEDMNYITVEQAAEQSSMKPDVIRDMLRKNEIAGAVKIRRSWRLPNNWVEQFKEAGNAEL